MPPGPPPAPALFLAVAQGPEERPVATSVSGRSCARAWRWWAAGRVGEGAGAAGARRALLAVGALDADGAAAVDVGLGAVRRAVAALVDVAGLGARPAAGHVAEVARRAVGAGVDAGGGA